MQELSISVEMENAKEFFNKKLYNNSILLCAKVIEQIYIELYKISLFKLTNPK